LGWWEHVGVGDFERAVLGVRGIDVSSEVVAVNLGRQEDGAQFVAIRVRSTHRNSGAENVATCYVGPNMSLEQFKDSVQRSREWFADRLAQECLGVAPPLPSYWMVVVSNPNDASRRVQGLAVCDPTVPRSLLSLDFCAALGLPATADQCEVLIRVLGKRFLAAMAPARIPMLAVIGADLVERAITEDVDRERLLESFFLDPAARSYVARRNSREKTVLAIGSYRQDRIKRLRLIEGSLFKLCYDPVLIADYPTEGESLESKFLSFATISRFVIYEATISSGGIDEFKICKDNDFITAVVHEKGHIATEMQSHYPVVRPFIKFFPYEEHDLDDVLRIAAQWAESIVSLQENSYPRS